ncbi:MAG: hypothetical protein C0501_29630 [Isosphaera sp.]|nr:hypothetical protein [Isosphaera sp.]
MLGKLVEFFKGLFGGKGGTQLGSGNVSTSVARSVTVTAGRDAQHVTVADIVNNITHAAVPPPAFEPRPDEAEILTRLADSRDKTLLLVRLDSVAGFAVLIDAKELAGPRDAEAGLRYVEAVGRLREHKLLVDHAGDGQVFHLSAEGREWARKLRGKCPECGRPTANVGDDPARPPVWECGNARCVRSRWHRDARCPTCGKRPSVVTDGGVNFTSFLCEDGHPFTTSSSKS